MSRLKYFFCLLLIPCTIFAKDPVRETAPHHICLAADDVYTNILRTKSDLDTAKEIEQIQEELYNDASFSSTWRKGVAVAVGGAGLVAGVAGIFGVSFYAFYGVTTTMGDLIFGSSIGLVVTSITVGGTSVALVVKDILFSEPIGEGEKLAAAALKASKYNVDEAVKLMRSKRLAVDLDTSYVGNVFNRAITRSTEALYQYAKAERILLEMKMKFLDKVRREAEANCVPVYL